MKNTNLVNLYIVILIAIFSGISMFIYEVIWTRLLALVFGTTTIAGAIVIATFLFGLGLGGLCWGLVIDRIEKKKLFLGLIEFGVGVSAMVLIFILPRLTEFYKFLYTRFSVTIPTIIILSVSSFFIISLPTFLMGAIFPVLVKIYADTTKRIGHGIGLIYTAISVGGIIGAVSTGAFLIRNLGQIQTQLLAIFINITIGIIVFIIPEKKGITQYKEDRERQINVCGRASFLPVVAAVTGFAGLGLEILWLRALSIFLANATYTFIIVIVTYLSGITLGGYIFSRFLEPRIKDYFYLIMVLAGIGIYVIITTFFINQIPGLLFSASGLLKSTGLRIILPPLFFSFILMFLPALFMGISFPLICRLYNRSRRRLGEGIGKIYFLNTVGSIIGSIVAGFILIPAIGVVRGIVLVGLIYLLTGGAVVYLTKTFKKRFNLFFVGAGILSAVLSVMIIKKQHNYILPPSIMRSSSRSDRVLYYKETSSGTVVVTEDRFTGIRACYINNSAVCGITYDALKVVKMLGELPFLFNPRAETALVIGFGIGITSATIARHPIIKLDCVEICPGVREAGRYFIRYNNNIIKNPKVNFIAGDGRNYLLLSNKKYDIISCDPTHPALGCGNLYTREFFRLVKKHLKEDGVFAQYLPLHKLSNKEFKIAIKTFATVFPHTTVWLGHSHGILLGSAERAKLDFRFLRDVLNTIEDEILNDPYLFVCSLLLDEDAVRDLTKESRINSDNRPYLEFFGIDSPSPENWVRNLNALLKFRINPESVVVNIDDREVFSRYLLGQKYFLNGLKAQNQRRLRETIKFFRMAQKLNPENNEIKIFLNQVIREYHFFMNK